MIIHLSEQDSVFDNCQSSFTAKGKLSFSKLTFEFAGKEPNSYVTLSILIYQPPQQGVGHILLSWPVIIPAEL